MHPGSVARMTCAPARLASAARTGPGWKRRAEVSSRARSSFPSERMAIAKFRRAFAAAAGSSKFLSRDTASRKATYASHFMPASRITTDAVVDQTLSIEMLRQRLHRPRRFGVQFVPFGETVWLDAVNPRERRRGAQGESLRARLEATERPLVDALHRLRRDGGHVPQREGPSVPELLEVAPERFLRGFAHQRGFYDPFDS